MNKTIKALALLATAILMGVSAPVMAQTAAATPAGPTVTFNGLADAYITYNFNDGAHSFGNVDHYWDTNNNQFSLGLAESKVTVSQNGATGVFELAYQDNPDSGLAWMATTWTCCRPMGLTRPMAGPSRLAVSPHGSAMK